MFRRILKRLNIKYVFSKNESEITNNSSNTRKIHRDFALDRRNRNSFPWNIGLFQKLWRERVTLT